MNRATHDVTKNGSHCEQCHGGNEIAALVLGLFADISFTHLIVVELYGGNLIVMDNILNSCNSGAPTNVRTRRIFWLDFCQIFICAIAHTWRRRRELKYLPFNIRAFPLTSSLSMSMRTLAYGGHALAGGLLHCMEQQSHQSRKYRATTVDMKSTIVVYNRQQQNNASYLLLLLEALQTLNLLSNKMRRNGRQPLYHSRSAKTYSGQLFSCPSWKFDLGSHHPGRLRCGRWYRACHSWGTLPEWR